MRPLLFLAVLALVAPASSQLTLAQLDTNARTLTLDAKSDRQRFSDAQIYEWINEGQQNLIGYSRCLRASYTFSLIPGVTYYQMPADFQGIERVTIGGKMIPQMTPASLDSQSLGWEYESGYPNRYFVNYASRTLVGFAPFPQQSTDTDTIKVDYTVQANQLVNPTDIPFNGSPDLYTYQFGLAYFAASVMAAIQGQQAQSQLYMQLYTATAATMQQKCIVLTNYLPSASSQP